ncbi:MAG: hypothetical protein EXR60_04930 [Dehalococcoidia bacterium]|nr:hypothetical protein [Dehalococcoidia bacterium]
MSPSSGALQEAVSTHCPYCALQCGMRIQGPPGQAVVAGEADFPVNRGALRIKGWTAGETLAHPDRLTQPLARDDSGLLVPVTWEEAVARVVRAIQTCQARYGRDAVGVFGGGSLTNEKAYLLGKFARVALGTRNIDYNGPVSLLLGGGLLIAAAIPSLSLATGVAGVSSFPEGIESKEGFRILDEKFSAGQVTPAEIVINGDIASEPVQAGVGRLQAALARDAAFGAPRPLEVNAAGDVALLVVPVAGDAVNTEAQETIKRLRGQHVPAAFAGVPATVLVTGETAFNMDFVDTANSAAPIVFAFVLGISFLLLMVAFRSIVVPIKAIILNLLSVGAAYGIIVLVFQKGVGNEVFGFQQYDIVEAWIPLFLFSVLFGLSMDYHVFLLSRIRERFDQTQDNTGSVAFGIRSTGRLISGAALIMVSVFWGFAAGDLVGLQQVGFGLGTAVLLDATIVRSVLVPASMKLLGKWNWYLPAALRWLPDLRVESKRKATAPE